MSNASFNFGLPPQDAIDYLKSKGQALTFNYDEMLHEAHHNAFTVAKITNLDLVKDIHNSLIDAIEKGKPFEQWKKELKPTLIEKGWYGKTTVTNPKTGEVKDIHVGSRRLKNIYDTNMRVAYSVGNYKQMMQLPDSTMWRYVAILDNRTRPLHRALNGLTLPRDDVWWT